MKHDTLNTNFQLKIELLFIFNLQTTDIQISKDHEKKVVL